MLVNRKMFDTVEAILRENGSIKRFENECGEIKGRMMITMTDIPEGIAVEERDSKAPVAFEASFDFYDSTVGPVGHTTGRRRRGTCRGLGEVLYQNARYSYCGGWFLWCPDLLFCE